MTMQLSIFNSEKEDQIDNLVAESFASSVHTTFSCASKPGLNTIPATLVDALNTLVPSDSALVHCILVSTDWNKNDDVFTPVETWNARKTPIHKPANKDHLGKQIDKKNQTFGVIINSNAVDDDYNILSENPNKYFHILTSVQLWEKYWPNLVQEVKQNITEGNQYVSMECAMGNFGYALREKEGSKIYLLDRNEKTAKLTKFLKAYKGKGVITLNGKTYQIGRWLKDILFTGIGFVEKPANPESIVFEEFVSHASENEDEEMFEHIDFDELEEEFSESLLKNSVLNNIPVIKGEDMPKETVDNKNNQVQASEDLAAQIASLQATIAELTSANAALCKDKDDMSKAMQALEAKIKDTECNLQSSQATLAAIEQSRLVEARFKELSELQAVAGIDEDEFKAKEKLGGMDKNTYAAVLQMAKASIKSTSVTQTGLPKATDQTLTSETKSTEASEKKTDAEALAEAKAEVKEDVTTVVAKEKAPELVQAALANFFDKKSKKK